MGKLAPLAAMLVVLSESGARAELGPIRPEFQVSKGFEYYNEGKFSIDIGASAAGTFVVAWEDLYQEITGDGIFARRFDPLGRPLGGEFRTTPFTANIQGSSHVASDAAGNFIVVWDGGGPYSTDTSGLGITAQRFDASGGAVGLPFQVNTLTIGSQWTPKVAFDGAGNFMVVWAHAGGTILAGQKYSSTGAPVGGQFQVNTDTSCCVGYNGSEDPGLFDDIEIAGDAAGNFVVAWRGPSVEDEDYPNIIARVFDGSGSATGAFVVNTATNVWDFLPAVAADHQGNFIIAWTEGYPGVRISARRYTSTGLPIGGDFRVNDDDDYVGASDSPSIAADASGRFVIVWREYDNNLHAVMGREFDSTGAPVGGPFRIDEPAAEGYSDNYIMRAGKVAASAAGDFVVVWGQYGTYPAYDPGVVGRRLGQRAAPCSPTPLVGCRETTVAGSGVLNLKKSSNPARSRLTWRFARGPQATPQDFGDPFTTDSYSVCLYDGSANPQPLYDAAVPGNGACGTIPCWRELSGQRVAYFDVKEQFVNGITEIRLSPGNAGRSRAMVKGKGSRLVLPDTPLSAPVTLQLQGSHGECWTAEYGEFIRRNEGGVFKANPGGIPVPTTIPPPSTTTSSSTSTTAVPTTTSTTVPVCGNGFLEGTEECDDGNAGEVDGCSSVCTCNPATTPAVCNLSGDWQTELAGLLGLATFVEDAAGNWTASGTVLGGIPFEAAGTRSNSCAVGILQTPFSPPEGVPIRMYVNDACDGALVVGPSGPSVIFTRLP